MVRAGDGVAPDFSRARELIEASIAAGNVAGGSVALGDLYRQSAPPDRDLVKAVAAYEQAVAAGDPGAMLTLAQMLKTGDGVAADPARARTLIESAIALGAVNRGALALGDLYRQATPPDYAKALAAYEQSMATGNTWAMLALADMYRNGQGVAADTDRARALMEQAITGGNVGAGAFALGELYRLGPSPDPVQALTAYELAATAGNAEADLIAAKLVSASYTSADGLRSMVDHLVVAAKSLEPRRVALDMLQLPPQPLIAAVQQLLGDNGERVGTPDGTHGARTKRAIRDFCARRGVADCDEEFITIGLVVALLQQPEAEPATQ
jgi:TPR repeat protein